MKAGGYNHSYCSDGEKWMKFFHFTVILFVNTHFKFVAFF